jgi:hypothetical protein
MAKETVRITLSEYERLLERDEWLGYLEAGGVDNWQGIEFAVELRNEDRRREDKEND